MPTTTATARSFPLSFRLALGVLLSLFALGRVGVAAAQQSAGAYRDERTIPKTAAYQRALEVLEAVNSGEESVIRALVEGGFNESFRGMVTLEEHIEMFREVRSINGGLDAYSARVYETPRPETNAVLICRGRVSELWRAIVVDVEPEAPHLIAGIGFMPAPSVGSASCGETGCGGNRVGARRVCRETRRCGCLQRRGAPGEGRKGAASEGDGDRESRL